MMMVSAVMCCVYLLLQVLHLSTVTFLYLLQELQSSLQVLHQLPFHAHVPLCMACPKNIKKRRTNKIYSVTEHVFYTYIYIQAQAHTHIQLLHSSTNTDTHRHIHPRTHTFRPQSSEQEAQSLREGGGVRRRGGINAPSLHNPPSKATGEEET